MLLITRKFRVSVSCNQCEVIEKKLNELKITGFDREYFKTEYKGNEIERFYYKCLADEEKMNLIIDFLQNDFKGVASICY